MEIDIDFERECYRCDGSTRWSGKGCEACANTGRVATSLGDELMQFLENQKRRDAAAKAREEVER